MTSRQAFAAAAQVRHRVKESSFVGDRQMHLFMLPWLLCKGMTTDQLVTALRLFDELQRDSFDARSLGEQSRARRKGRQAELTTLCAGLQLEPARFSTTVVNRYPRNIEAAMKRRQIFVELGALPDGAPGRRAAEPRD